MLQLVKWQRVRHDLVTEQQHREGNKYVNESEYLEEALSQLVGIFSLGLGNDEPERTTLGQSLARTDKFISAVEPFYRSRNKELRVYGQQSAYGVKT